MSKGSSIDIFPLLGLFGAAAAGTMLVDRPLGLAILAGLGLGIVLVLRFL